MKKTTGLGLDKSDSDPGLILSRAITERFG